MAREATGQQDAEVGKCTRLQPVDWFVTNVDSQVMEYPLVTMQATHQRDVAGSVAKKAISKQNAVSNK